MKTVLLVMVSMLLLACDSYYLEYHGEQHGIKVDVLYRRFLHKKPPYDKFTDMNIPSLYPSMIQGNGTIENTNTFNVTIRQYRTMHSHHNPGTKLVNVYTLRPQEIKQIRLSATELFEITVRKGEHLTTIKTTYWRKE